MRRLGNGSEGKFAAAMATNNRAFLVFRGTLLVKSARHDIDRKAWILAIAVIVLGGFGKTGMTALGADKLL